MSSQELEKRLSKIGDDKFVADARHFLLNLYVLFDGQPPAHIERCINDVLNLLEDRALARRVFF